MSSVLKAVSEADLSVAGLRLLSGASFALATTGIHVVLGPAGTGKSSLLKALAGVDGLECRGTWGANVPAVWLPQLRGSAKRLTGEPPLVDPELEAALAAETGLLLLDEPDRRVRESSRAKLAQDLRKKAETTCIVVVTHEQTFARQIADHVLFVCAGRQHYSGPAASFFEHPPNRLAERFLALGNCWPLEEDLPEHFRWIIPSQFAGMGRPGMLREASLDLDALAGAGITLLVSLTEVNYPVAELRQYGIGSRHFPITDMGVPSLGPTASLCGYVERTIVGGGRVAVHCHAGLGRTGLILASFLVWLGEAPTSAIESVRAIRPQYIQTKSQAEFVHRFAEQAGVGAEGTRRTLVEARVG